MTPRRLCRVSCPRSSWQLVLLPTVLVVAWAWTSAIDARNLPYRIQHENQSLQAKPSPAERQLLNRAESSLRHAQDEYQRALHEARKYQGLAPTNNDSYGYQRHFAEEQLMRAERNVRMHESDLYALHRRFERRAKDQALRQQRDHLEERYANPGLYPRHGSGAPANRP